MLTKIHHALIDGLSGAEILGALFDLEPEGREVTERMPAPDARPSDAAMLARGIAGLPPLPAAHAAVDSRRRSRTSTRRPSGRFPAPATVSRLAERAAKAIGRDGGAREAQRPEGAARRRSTAASRRTGASPSASSRLTR